MKQRILYLTYHTEIGGGETSLIYLLQKLDKHIFAPLVVVPAVGQVSQRLQKLDIPVQIIPMSGFFWRKLFIPGLSLRTLWRLFKLVKEFRPRLIHVNHLNLVIYVGILGKSLGIPVVATAHGTWDAIYFYHEWLNHLCCTRILAISPQVAKWLTRFHILPNDKIRVVPLGVDITGFIPPKSKLYAKRRLQINPQKKVVTMVCRFDFAKNHLLFLQIANRVVHHISDVQFLLVGDWMNNLEPDSSQSRAVKHQLDTYLAKHPLLKPHVRFTGFVSDMVPVFQATDILFSSSLSETLPVSFLEGGACGLPLVALANTSTSEIVISNRTGFLIEHSQPQLLYMYLMKLLTHPTLCHHLGQNARTHIVNNFSLSKYAHQVETEYLSIIQTF